MWGLPILWWGRIGKILQFSGGAVVVLDLIGPERIVQLAERSKGRLKALRAEAVKRLRAHPALMERFIYLIVLASLFGIYGLASVANSEFREYGIDVAIGYGGMAIGTILFFFGPYVTLLLMGKVLSLGRRANLARWIAFVLVVLGFHLDLLAS